MPEDGRRRLAIYLVQRRAPAAGDDATAARLDELIARARRQHDAVERYRVEAGARAVSAVRAP